MIAVYIASPYTKGDVAQNVRVQLDVADELMALGYCPIVPLFSHFQHLHKPRPYEDWMRIDEEKIRRCDVVLRLPGESAGADREVRLAESLGIPVVHTTAKLVAIKIRERKGA
jgi:hypothetical protein